MFLKENKRLKNDDDKLKLKNINYDVLKTNLPINEIINKYSLNTTDKIINENNIAYTNNKCSNVSKYVRKMLNKKNDYEVGEKLICIKYFKVKGMNVNKNFEYIINQITNTHITLMDELTLDTLALSLKQIETFFKHSYCYTCHSRQGSTIKKPITIHQWDFKYVSRKWLYTAITRTTELNNVYFMIDKEKQNKERKEKSKSY